MASRINDLLAVTAASKHVKLPDPARFGLLAQHQIDSGINQLKEMGKGIMQERINSDVAAVLGSVPDASDPETYQKQLFEGLSKVDGVSAADALGLATTLAKPAFDSRAYSDSRLDAMNLNNYRSALAGKANRPDYALFTDTNPYTGAQTPYIFDKHATNPSLQSLSGYVSGIESNGSYTAQNPNSSAYGKYQLINDTNNTVAKRLGVSPEYLRTPEGQEVAFKALVAEYTPQLKQLGVPVTNDSILALHQMGLPTFKKYVSGTLTPTDVKRIDHLYSYKQQPQPQQQPQQNVTYSQPDRYGVRQGSDGTFIDANGNYIIPKAMQKQVEITNPDGSSRFVTMNKATGRDAMGNPVGDAPKPADRTVQLQDGTEVYVDHTGQPVVNTAGQYLVKRQSPAEVAVAKKRALNQVETEQAAQAKLQVVNGVVGEVNKMLDIYSKSPDGVASIGSSPVDWAMNNVNDILKVPTKTNLGRNQIEAMGGRLAAQMRSAVETGVMTDKDFDRYMKLVPAVDDSPELFKYKADMLKSSMAAQFGQIPAGYKQQVDIETGFYRLVPISGGAE